VKNQILRVIKIKMNSFKSIVMKQIKIFSFAILVIFLMPVACKKQSQELPAVSTNPRKVQFVLYTKEDFSTYNGNITFTLTIRNHRTRAVWDSILPVMKVKDIPTVANKLVIEKEVPGNDQELLDVGFIYYLENVGISWYMIDSPAGEAFQKVEYAFR
jgi:hypothetical protein